MELVGKLIGFVVFIAAAIGLYFLLKGKGRLDSIGRWSTLEDEFRVDAMPASFTYTSGMVGMGTYTGTLKLALTATGVYLDLPAVARFGSKPICIPYADWHVSAKNPTIKYGFRTYTQFTVRGQSICIEQDDAKKILARRQTTPL